MSTSPQRPPQVPPEARWNAGDNEWELGQDRAGTSVGEWTWWRPDGSLVCRSTFDEGGRLDGVCRRFHPDGSVSMESRYVKGVRWGKTRHTRPLHGTSPENQELGALPPQVHEIALVYQGGVASPIKAALDRAGVETPPESRLGVLTHFERDVARYLPGTVMLVIGSFTDIAGRRFDLPALFFDGLAMADGSILRFAFAPPGTRTSTLPTWQDPSYGTAVSTAEAKAKMVIAVDYADPLYAAGVNPPDPGFKVDIDDGRVSLRVVDPGGAAAGVGLAAGDVIVGMNDRPVTGLLDYLEGRVDYATTRHLRLDVLRGSEARRALL